MSKEHNQSAEEWDSEREKQYQRRGRARLAAFARAVKVSNETVEGTPQRLKTSRRVRDIGVWYGILSEDAGFWFVAEAAEPLAADALAKAVDSADLLAITQQYDDAKRQGDARTAGRAHARLFKLLAPFLVAVLDVHGEDDAALTVASGYRAYEKRKRAGQRDFDKMLKSGGASVYVNR